jgi:hypothetical protein
METIKKQKLIKSIVGIALALALFFASGIKLPVLDTETDTYFQKAITEAGLAYATCRVINASVSVVKESKLELGPMGVGVSLAVGQVLDPIDDMTERLSDVLVTAITSLGVQKLAYEICVALTPPVLAVLLLAFAILLWPVNQKAVVFRGVVGRIVLLILAARLCLPIAALVNETLYRQFFAEEINAAKKELAMGSVELEKLTGWSLPQVDGVLGTLENSAAFLKKKSIELQGALGVIIANMGSIIESLLRLTFLYVGIFVIQVIALPLMIFWGLVKSAHAFLPF